MPLNMKPTTNDIPGTLVFGCMNDMDGGGALIRCKWSPYPIVSFLLFLAY